MKNILKIISLLFLIIGCSDKESNIIKIGLIEPLTGDLAMYGKPISEGALVAIAEANKKSTKYKFKLVIEDTKSETKQAITAVKKLINFDNISFIVGPGISSQMLAIAPIVEKNEVLTIGTTCENSKISQAGSYIFRVYPSYLLHGKTLAEYTINDLKLKKAAIILINNDFGIDISKEFKKEFESKGGLVVAEESYTDNTTDFRLILTKLKEKNPDIIFMSSYIAEYPRILKQAKEIGLNSRFLASSSFYDEKILKLSGSTAEGVIASTSLYDIESKEKVINDYVKKYKKLFNQKPDYWSGYGYDATNLIISSILESENNVKEAINYLNEINSFKGVTGSLSFDKNGDVFTDIRIVEVKDSKFETVKIIN